MTPDLTASMVDTVNRSKARRTCASVTVGCKVHKSSQFFIHPPERVSDKAVSCSRPVSGQVSGVKGFLRLTCSCMRAYDSEMRTTASSWRTVIGTTGVSLSFSRAAARACRPDPFEPSPVYRCNHSALL